MRSPSVNDYVRLTRDIPELALSRGEIGIVRSQWCAPELAYEVEFHASPLDSSTRALLMADQIVVEDGAMFELETVSVEVHA